MDIWFPKREASGSVEESDTHPINVDLHRKVTYFEWILIVICGLAEYAYLTFAHPTPVAPNLVISLIFLLIVFLLSFVIPARSTYWDRMCFLFLEIVLLTGCSASGLSRVVSPLYMVSIAKSCLILDKTGQGIIFATALVTNFANGFFKAYINPDLPQYMHSNPWSLGAIFSYVGVSFVDNYATFAMIVLVEILTLTLVSEQKARFEAEHLSKEVESLATELERTRIAQEIHDSLGHTLTSLNIQLEVSRKFFERDQKRAYEALDLAKQLAGQSLTDVRTAIQSIRQPDFDLKESINSLTKQMQANQQLEILLDISTENIPKAIGYQLFRIVQECLTNVMKHAEATQVKVSLLNDNKKIELRVSDNGKGLPAELKSQGFGIRGMQERVESMHGNLEIESSPGKGTNLQVTIPL